MVFGPTYRAITIEDIYWSTTLIAVNDKFWEKELLDTFESKSNYSDWSKKIKIMNHNQLCQEKITYRSISFTEGLSYANILLRAQKRMAIRGYHITQISIAKKYILSYGVNDEFPFVERFNEIIHWIRSAGLYDVWLQEEYKVIEDNIIKTNLNLVDRRTTRC